MNFLSKVLLAVSFFGSITGMSQLLFAAQTDPLILYCTMEGDPKRQHLEFEAEVESGTRLVNAGVYGFLWGTQAYLVRGAILDDPRTVKGKRAFDFFAGSGEWAKIELVLPSLFNELPLKSSGSGSSGKSDPFRSYFEFSEVDRVEKPVRAAVTCWLKRGP